RPLHVTNEAVRLRKSSSNCPICSSLPKNISPSPFAIKNFPYYAICRLGERFAITVTSFERLSNDSNVIMIENDLDMKCKPLTNHSPSILNFP
ncbi:MAG: hypothetical protein IKP87_14710, partial [Victivallales bacterium]|nr:hypothetical protein [Victivallales bacterium]